MTKKQKIVMWSIIGMVLTEFLVLFFTTLHPLILKAAGIVI